MTLKYELEHALAMLAVMRPEQQKAVEYVFKGIAAGFPDVRDALIQAVADEALAIETEMLLLGQDEGHA